MAVNAVSKRKARDYAYGWLAEQIGSTTHIGDLDIAGCQRIIAICKTYPHQKVSFISSQLEDIPA